MKANRQTACCLAIAALITAPAALAYNDFSARMDCLSRVTAWGSGYSDAHDVNTESVGYNAYNVNGRVRDRDNRERDFNCRIENREVVNWNVSSSRSDDHKKDSRNKALAVGAGIVGLAALAAVIASSKSGDQKHDESRTEYNNGKENPFGDMRYLKTECRRVVRHHLAKDHGAVDDLDLEQASLNGRVLSGSGRVTFESGGARNLTYSCEFDRGGSIYDGHYSYGGGS